MAKTHDFTDRYYGHDYCFYPIDHGLRGQMIGWGDDVHVGDYLILQNPPNGTRYRVTSISYYVDPPDMWTANVEFDPRKPGK